MSTRDVHLQRIEVPFEYPVCFTVDSLDPDNEALIDVLRRPNESRPLRVFAVIDAGVAVAWPDLVTRIQRYAARHAVELAGEPLVVPGGEFAKNDRDTLDLVHRRLFELGMDRHAFVLIIGGGAVQDMAGFAASTAHRGMRVVRMPTTVLSQNDAGIGVKNGVNAFGTKNFLGTFAPPFAVVNDIAFIDTLEPRDRRAGMAEAVKVALIRDASFFEWLDEHAAPLAAFEREATAQMIRRCATLHLDHIAQSGDPFEWGTARPLDYGHWSAHKLEVLSQHGLRHGEAVAIGMALDARYAFELGMLSGENVDRICGLLEMLGLRLFHEALTRTNGTPELEVLDGLREFREHLGGELTIPLLAGIGQRVDVHEMDATVVARAARWLEARG